MTSFERGFMAKLSAVVGNSLLGTAKGIKSGLRGATSVEKAKSMQTTVARATPPSLPVPRPVHVQHNLSAKLPDQRTMKMTTPKPVKQSGNGVPSVPL